MEIIKSTKNKIVNQTGNKIQYKTIHCKIGLDTFRIIEPKSRRTTWELNPYGKFKYSETCNFEITPFSPVA